MKVVHYNPKGKLMGGRRNNWLIALDMTFEYLDHPLANKWVKDQVVVVLKSRRTYLKKCIENGLD
jgi:hypothetical protein